MTNQHAKDILDFLAKKIEFNAFVINKDTVGGFRCPCLIRDFSDVILTDLYLCDSNGSVERCILIPDSVVTSYVEILLSMIKLCSKGHHVEICNNDVFMQAYTTLEQLEIQFELQRGMYHDT